MMLASLLVAAAVAAPESDARSPPPPPPERPSVHDLGVPAQPAIFTYSVDGRCRVTDTRRLQGPDQTLWQDVDEALEISDRRTVYRFVEGLRTQLIERRVRLLGEMVREGTLVCHLRPSGEVIEAWIEVRDDASARRRAPVRERQQVSEGRIGDLGTYSVSLPAS